MKLSTLEASLGILADSASSGLGRLHGCQWALGGQTVDENEPQEAFLGILVDRAISGPGRLHGGPLVANPPS